MEYRVYVTHSICISETVSISILQCTRWTDVNLNDDDDDGDTMLKLQNIHIQQVVVCLFSSLDLKLSNYHNITINVTLDLQIFFRMKYQSECMYIGTAQQQHRRIGKQQFSFNPLSLSTQWFIGASQLTIFHSWCLKTILIASCRLYCYFFIS